MVLKKNSIDTGKYFCLQNFACLKVAGKDAKAFLQNLIANDIELLEKNECLTSVITNTLGKVKFLVFIQKMGTDYLLFCELERIKKLQEHLEFFHIIEDVLFVNEKPKELFYILSTNPDEIFSLPEFKTSNHKTPSHSIFLRTHHYCILQADKDTFTLFLEKNNITKITPAELEQLRPIFAMSKAGKNLDYGEKNLPQECGFYNFFSLKKGCFVGQEGIARLQYKGKVMRRLTQIITNKKQILGRITSASAISYLGCFYSLGYIKTLFEEKKDALFNTDGVVIKKIIPL